MLEHRTVFNGLCENPSQLLTLSLNKNTTTNCTQMSHFQRLRCAVATSPADEPNRPPIPPRPALPEREVDSRELMQGYREIIIRHGDEAYRLSVTRSGKLILRK